MEDIVTLNGIEYVRRDRQTGRRCVIVLDRGWIYAGDVEDRDGRIYLTRVVHVLRWTGGQWFEGMIANPKRDVELLPSRDLNFPAAVEIFREPVADDWGL